jgi:hypothetical protein
MFNQKFLNLKETEMPNKNNKQVHQVQKTYPGDRIGNLSAEESLMKFAQERNYVPNQVLALYLIYGDEPAENWESPIPAWVKKLPAGPALKKLEK